MKNKKWKPESIEELIKKYNMILEEAVNKIENEIEADSSLILECQENDLSKINKIRECIEVIKDTIV